MAAWLGRINAATGKRALMWQVPNGNQVYRSENNTSGHYQDNRAQFFLNATTGRQHMTQWANYGVLGVMFCSAFFWWYFGAPPFSTRARTSRTLASRDIDRVLARI